METPSSTRRVTRSQTMASATASNNSHSIPTMRKLEESEKPLTKSRQRTAKQQDRSALFDITNDSPIVGLATGNLATPSSAMSKKRVAIRAKHENTPGSGEALLRSQVKTLLQRVEEEAEISKFSLEQHGPFLPLKSIVDSPMGLMMAPTPANTPQVLTLSAQINELVSLEQSPIEDKFVISQMISEIFDGKKQEEDESKCDESLTVTRSLLLDFSEKSEGSCSSVVTYQGTESEGKEKATADDDDASIWSIQVNASTRDEQEEDDDDDEQGLEEVEEEECDDEFYYEEEEEDEAESEMVDELCEALSKINVGVEKPMPKFSGKHIRFCYNSNDEIDGEELVAVCSSETESATSSSDSTDVLLRLKGLPTPRGKHLRFSEEMDGN